MNDKDNGCMARTQPEQSKCILCDKCTVLYASTNALRLFNVSDEIVPNSDMYKNKDLTQEQTKMLIGMGYEMVSGPNLGAGNGRYFIKNDTGNQGSYHFIMVRLIQEAAHNLKLITKINDYGKMCDVVVQNGFKERIGFEIETGTNNAKSLLIKTERLDMYLKPRVPEHKIKQWFYVVKHKHKKKYVNLHEDVIASGEVTRVLLQFKHKYTDGFCNKHIPSTHCQKYIRDWTP